MPPYANVADTLQSSGFPYAIDTALPAAEADLFNLSSPLPYRTPIPIKYAQAISAFVRLSVSGAIVSNTSYVVLQTDLGDDYWIDVAWCRWTGTSGETLFVLSAGVDGANSVQQTRAVGTAPGTDGSRQMPLGDRVRFVGKAAITTSGVSSSGAGPSIRGTIRYKLLGLR